MAKRICAILMLSVFYVFVCGCTESDSTVSIHEDMQTSENTKTSEDMQTSENSQSEQEEPVLKITTGSYVLDATFENNRSAEEFKELLRQGPVTVAMEDYGGFEKVGALSTTLTRSDEQITTQPGDVILYQGNQITIYYGTNSWNFTKLATINDPSDLKEKLGTGTVQVTFSLEPGV